MTKTLEQMTVEELVKGHPDFSDINILNELIRRAKLAESKADVIKELNDLIRDDLTNNGDDAITKETYEDMNFSAGAVIEIIERRIKKLKELLGESCK